MSTHRSPFCWGAVALIGLALAGTSAADVVRTQDGRVLEGKVVEVAGDRLEVQTPLGSFTIPRSEVSAWERCPTPHEEYASRRQALEQEAGVEDHYALARWCESKGLASQARAHFQEVVELDAGHEGARRALGWRRIDGRWVSPDRVLEEAGFVREGGRWMLPGERELLDHEGTAVTTLDDLTARNVRALVSIDPEARSQAEASLIAADPARVLPQLLIALRDERWDLRAGAARMLGKIGGERVEPTLVTRALVDRVAAVRGAAVEGLREGNHRDIYAPFVRAMAADEMAIRVNAVAALGELGDERAVGYLVKHIHYTGSGPRSHIYIGRQIAYVRDYDVEVAQRAAIADPIIGTIQDGLVLDVQVTSIEGDRITIERRYTSGALGRLTGAEPPGVVEDSRAAWTHWWRENRHDYEPGGARYRAP